MTTESSGTLLRPSTVSSRVRDALELVWHADYAGRVVTTTSYPTTIYEANGPTIAALARRDLVHTVPTRTRTSGRSGKAVELTGWGRMVAAQWFGQRRPCAAPGCRLPDGHRILHDIPWMTGATGHCQVCRTQLPLNGTSVFTHVTDDPNSGRVLCEGSDLHSAETAAVRAAAELEFIAQWAAAELDAPPDPDDPGQVDELTTILIGRPRRRVINPVWGAFRHDAQAYLAQLAGQTPAGVTARPITVPTTPLEASQ
jgi:hypothetical protein